MVGTVCVPGGDHFSRCRNFDLDVCEPEELAELYYVADFYDLCSFVPIILYLTGIIYVPYLALAALRNVCILFLGTLIIGDRRARVELKRRFHIR